MVVPKSLKVDIVNYVLIVIFGISSWISVNSVWVELPVFVNALPEKWALPSYFSIIIQLANLIILLSTAGFNLFKKYRSHRSSTLMIDINNNIINETKRHSNINWHASAIYAVLILQLSVVMATPFRWDQLTLVAGSSRSVSLLILLFFMALANCSSSILFMPFMSTFPAPAYVTAYYLGSGLSGLLPSFLSLAQGIGEMNGHNLYLHYTHNLSITRQADNHTFRVPSTLKPRFGISTFFGIILAVLLISAFAFYALSWRRIIERRLRVANFTETASESKDMNDVNFQSSEKSIKMGDDNQQLVPEISTSINRINSPSSDQVPVNTHTSSTAVSYKFGPDGQRVPTTLTCSILLFLLACLSALDNGVIPSIQSYAALPYGNMAFHLSVSLSSLSNPLACFMAFFRPLALGAKHYYFLAGICALLSSIILGFALKSPHPPLAGTLAGTVLTVVLWIVLETLFSYIKVSLASEFHRKGKKWLMWHGICTQLGSALGAFLIFVMINYLKLFKSSKACV
ncbi:unnamed protein product [Gordionus sp. m RMFG-2023]